MAGPLLLAAGAVRTMASPFLFRPTLPVFVESRQGMAAAQAFAAWRPWAACGARAR